MLKGHLNQLQDEALQWLVIDEITRDTEIEQERMKYTILSGNIKLYQELYPIEEENDDGEIEWITPKSAEEVQLLEQMLNQIQSAEEQFSDQSDANRR